VPTTFTKSPNAFFLELSATQAALLQMKRCHEKSENIILTTTEKCFTWSSIIITTTEKSPVQASFNREKWIEMDLEM
jgi:hypothetical protein